RAKALVVEAGGFSPDDVEDSWAHHRFAPGFPADLLDVMEVEEQWLAAQTDRAPRSRAELAGLIDTSVYEDALALGTGGCPLRSRRALARRDLRALAPARPRWGSISPIPPEAARPTCGRQRRMASGRMNDAPDCLRRSLVHSRGRRRTAERRPQPQPEP